MLEDCGPHVRDPGAPETPELALPAEPRERAQTLGRPALGSVPRPSSSPALRLAALPRQDLQILKRRQQPLSCAVTTCHSQAASQPLFLLLTTRRRSHFPHSPAAGARAERADAGAWRGGGLGRRKSHPGEEEEVRRERPLCAWRGALRAPAPSAGPARAFGSKPWDPKACNAV